MVQDIFQIQTHAGVRQDKATPGRIFTGSSEPINAGVPANQRPKHHGSQKRRVKEVSGCISPAIFAELERMRDQWAKAQGKKERLSRSEVVGTLITRGVQGNVDMQYGSMLEPVIKKTIKEQMQGDTNRAVYVAVKAYYSAEEARIINTKVLSYLFGSDTEIFKQLVAEARKEARANISRHINE